MSDMSFSPAPPPAGQPLPQTVNIWCHVGKGGNLVGEVLVTGHPAAVLDASWEAHVGPGHRVLTEVHDDLSTCEIHVQTTIMDSATNTQRYRMECGVSSEHGRPASFFRRFGKGPGGGGVVVTINTY